mmetsp:Transcript_19393/g.39649  ORF Transcript_19393/g.39649 Transcript_19393/m.39649 type:complete len:226 (-) Transcript_19393:611-1288(-)
MPPTVRKYRAVPVSGFFLMHQTLRGVDAFAEGMRATYKLHNASISPRCAASVPVDETWRCFFANYSYAHAQTPMFPIQSSVDLYQLFAILQAGGWDAGCLNRGIQFANCTTAQLLSFREYAQSILMAWGDGLTQGKATRPGEGAFIESCLEHVAEYWPCELNRELQTALSSPQSLTRALTRASHELHMSFTPSFGIPSPWADPLARATCALDGGAGNPIRCSMAT